MGVQRRCDAALAGEPVESVKVGEQSPPAGVVKDRPCVIPVGPGRSSENQSSCAGRHKALEGSRDLGDRIVGRLVQHDRHEAANGP
jgi:hypothetical protein